VARLLGEGAQVLAVDLPGSFAAAQVVASETLHILEQDLTEPGSAERIVRQAEERLDGLDILVNNAGIITPPRPFAEAGIDTLRRTLEINLIAVYGLCAAALRLLQRSEQGRIITIGSLNSLLPTAGVASYVASKHAVLGLTRNIAVETGAAGITANCVLPGAIDTPMGAEIERHVEGYGELVRQRTPLGRRGQPDDVAGAVVFLASEEAAFITGHGLVVDGGIGLGA
jgi:NAD(P)-dependent dehydrogenase (short-subunit alcohol dehydrogenase family)